MHLLRKSILVPFLLGGSVAVGAADFTFNVPLRIENVPSVETLGITCKVSRVRVSDPYPLGGTNVVGQGSAVVRPVGGRYSGTVRITVNASGINPAASAQSYFCSLRASGRAATGATYTASPGNMKEVYERATGHVLDRHVANVRGNF